MKWVTKASTYRAERNGKLLGYVQKDKDSNLYRWTCSAFAVRKESKNFGYNPELGAAKQALEDFWNLSLKHYGLIEDPCIKEKQESTDFSNGDVKDLKELFSKD